MPRHDGKTVGMTTSPHAIRIFLPDEDATTALGARLAELLRKGDTVLLEGPIGAGKSHLARALIRARLGRMEDVPSPSFTLVQTYESDPDIWHADLYRLSHPDEVLELGLEDAFATAICLVEWPDRLGPHLPKDALRLRLCSSDVGRDAHISGGRPGLLASLGQPA
jgi:tRNA threonylcarbamoyladenosine biosynthesis protein TsaE